MLPLHWPYMEAEGRVRPWLPGALVAKLRDCASRLDLPAGADLPAVIDVLVDEYLRHNGTVEPASKRTRGSTTAAVRDIVSETGLASLGWDVTELKHGVGPEVALEAVAGGLGQLPAVLRQLLLLVPETPRSGEALSRIDVAMSLIGGLKQFEELYFEALKCELAAVDDMAHRFFSPSTLSQQSGLASLAEQFKGACPRLQKLFEELAIGDHTAKNTLRTEDMKLESVLILCSAIGKVRNKNRVGFAVALHVLWKSLDLSADAINVLASLGLSVSAKDGAKRQRVQVDVERGRLATFLRKAMSATESCVVFDNVDMSIGSRSFKKLEVDVRQRLLHLTAASIIFLRAPPFVPRLVPVQRPSVLPLAALFADAECQQRILARVCDVLHHTLHGHGGSLIICGKLEAPSPWVNKGSLERSRRQALPLFWLEEGKVDHMYQFCQDIRSRYSTVARPAQWVHIVGDCFSLQKLLLVRELIVGENAEQVRADPEDFCMIFVPGWFHLYWNVFLGSVLQSDRDMLQSMVEIAGLKNVRLHQDISTCFNDIDHLVTLLYPVAVVRLFRFFVSVVAPKLGTSLKDLSEAQVMQNFTLFISHTVVGLLDCTVVLEWQRMCRLVLLLSIYRSLRVAIATEDQSYMMDVLHFSLTLVCQRSFKQYRKIVVEALAHWARSTPSERLLYMRCFTGNYSGGHHGGRAVDEIREFDNKSAKENLRRTHHSQGDLAPELELTEAQQDIRHIFASTFRGLDVTSGGSIPVLPNEDVVLLYANRVQWPDMLQPVKADVAEKQTALFNAAAHNETVKEALQALHRGNQFH